jgi:uridine kinase
MPLTYELNTINNALSTDPEAFVRHCDSVYWDKVIEAADMIEAHLPISPIVLLSGPSGSGKTTTALKLERELDRRGIKCTQ